MGLRLYDSFQMDALAKVCPKCGRRYDTAAAFCQKDGARLQLTDEQQPDPYIGQTLLVLLAPVSARSCTAAPARCSTRR